MLDTLPTGKPNAVTVRVLMERTGWTKRDVELAIERLRNDGYCVCSGSDGYWLAASIEEAISWEQAQSRRIHSMFRSLKGFRRGRKRMQGYEQRELWAA